MESLCFRNDQLPVGILESQKPNLGCVATKICMLYGDQGPEFDFEDTPSMKRSKSAEMYRVGRNFFRLAKDGASKFLTHL